MACWRTCSAGDFVIRASDERSTFSISKYSLPLYVSSVHCWGSRVYITGYMDTSLGTSVVHHWARVLYITGYEWNVYTSHHTLMSTCIHHITHWWVRLYITSHIDEYVCTSLITHWWVPVRVYITSHIEWVKCVYTTSHIDGWNVHISHHTLMGTGAGWHNDATHNDVISMRIW